MNAQIEYGVFLSPESMVSGLSDAHGSRATSAPMAPGVRSETQAWALHAARSGGFGAAEAAMEDGRSEFRGAAVPGGDHAETPGALKRWVNSLRQGWTQRWAAYQTVRRWRRQTRALEGLDGRLLKDLGVDMSEAGSVAAEIVGTALRTRRRIACSG